MTDISQSGDCWPLAAPVFQLLSDMDVEVGHAPIIAKFCAPGKRHFADGHEHSHAVASKSLNQVLAQALNRLMEERGLSNNRLGRMAKVAPNTIANYRSATGDEYTSRGKERSAKLAEVERIASALGVDPLYLLTDPDQHAKRVAAIAASAAGVAAQRRRPRTRRIARRVFSETADRRLKVAALYSMPHRGCCTASIVGGSAPRVDGARKTPPLLRLVQPPTPH